MSVCLCACVPVCLLECDGGRDDVGGGCGGVLPCGVQVVQSPYVAVDGHLCCCVYVFMCVCVYVCMCVCVYVCMCVCVYVCMCVCVYVCKIGRAHV